MTPEQKTRRRQWIIVLLVTLVLMLLIVSGLYLTDHRPAGKSLGTLGPSAAKLYSMPLDNLHPDQEWVSQGEQRLSQLDDREKKLEQLMNSLAATGAGHTALASADAATGGAGGALPIPRLASPAGGLLPTPLSAPLSAGGAEALAVSNGAFNSPGTRGESAASLGIAGNNEANMPVAKTSLMAELDVEPAAEHAPAAGGMDTSTMATGAPVAAASSVHTAKNYLPAGSFATVVLLSGFDAPTGGQASQNALPLVMRVKSFMRLPNQFKANIRECFITGSGYGDLASERAYIRTERLSCVLKNGQIFEKKIKGHVLGEDASFGMRGKLVSKQGSLIAKSFVSGLFAGIGNSIAAQSQMIQSSPLGTVSTIDPSKTMQAGMGGGLSTTSNRIADFYLQQANQIFPVIEISALRIGEVFLLEGVDFSTDTESHEDVAKE